MCIRDSYTMVLQHDTEDKLSLNLFGFTQADSRDINIDFIVRMKVFLNLNIANPAKPVCVLTMIP